MKKKNWLNIVLKCCKYAIALIIGAGVENTTNILGSVM